MKKIKYFFLTTLCWLLGHKVNEAPYDWNCSRCGKRPHYDEDRNVLVRAWNEVRDWDWTLIMIVVLFLAVISFGMWAFADMDRLQQQAVTTNCMEKAKLMGYTAKYVVDTCFIQVNNQWIPLDQLVIGVK